MTEVSQMIKVGDVFHIKYTEQHHSINKGWDLRHCFEGLAVAMQTESGIRLVDTFWGVNRFSENKSFSLLDIGIKIHIEYYCNLNEITKIHRLEVKYYADEDIIFLHDQHACVESCQYYYIKNGAVRSKGKILRVLNEEIADAESRLVYAQNSIEAKKKLASEIEAGKALNEIYF